jgi:hypothetical protein
MMNRNDLAELARLERLLDDRLTIVRVVIDANGKEVDRIVRTVLNSGIRAEPGAGPQPKKERP